MTYTGGMTRRKLRRCHIEKLSVVLQRLATVGATLRDEQHLAVFGA